MYRKLLSQFLILLIAPGFVISELLSLYRKDDSLSLKLAFIVGMSLAITIGIFGIWNVFVAPITLQVVNFYTVASIIAVLAVMLRAIIKDVDPNIVSRPKRSDYLVLFAIFILSLFTWLYFQKYPIFPAYPDTDYIQHTTNALATLSAKTPLPIALLYFGTEFLLAISLIGNSAPAIVTVREAMAFITILTVPIFYTLAEKAWNRSAGVIAVFIYLLGFVWVNIVYNSGTYPNFIGIAMSVFALAAFITIPEWGKVKGTLAFVIILMGLAFSHQTVLFVIPAFFVIAVRESVRLVKNKVELGQRPRGIRVFAWLVSNIVTALESKVSLKENWRAYIAPTTILILGMTVATILVRGFIFSFLSGLLAVSQPLAPSTPLGIAFPSVPMITIFDDDFAFVILGVFAIAGAIAVLKSGKGIGVLAWMVFGFVMSLFSGDWRFAYVLMVPELFLAAIGFHSILTMHFSDRLHGEMMKEDKRWTTTWAAVFILLLFITGSRGFVMLSDVTQFQSLAQDQQSVYNAIVWSGSNLANTTVISNTWQYSVYFDTLTKSDKVTALHYAIQTTADMNYLAAKGYHYFAMTNVTIAPSTIAFLNSTGHFRQVWSDGLTRLYTYSVKVNLTGQSV